MAIDLIMQYWNKNTKTNRALGQASLKKIMAVHLDMLLQPSCNIQILVPIMPNGSCNHSVCLIQDLICDLS